MFILTAVIIYLVFVFAEKPSTSKRKANTDDSINDTNPNSSACPHCTAVLSAPKNLKRHIRDVHNLDTSPMMCIDIRNGIYVTAKYDHSPFFPIHVIKSTQPQLDCEVEKCDCLVIRQSWKGMCSLGKDKDC